jgi:hypothetical protein
LGAVVSVFSVKGDMLTLRLWRKFGRAAYDKVVAEMKNPQWKADTMGFEDLGEVRDLSIQGTAINYVSSEGYKTSLTIAGGRLTGTTDPRPLQPYIATQTRDCR